MMDKNTTTEFLNSKIANSRDIKNFIRTHEHSIKTDTYHDYLHQLIESRHMKNTEFFMLAGLSESYGYQLLNGKRQPSRDKVIQSGFGLSLDVQTVNRLLKLSEKSELYVKNMRDAILIFSLSNQLSLIEVNQLLDEEGYDLLI